MPMTMPAGRVSCHAEHEEISWYCMAMLMRLALFERFWYIKQL